MVKISMDFPAASMSFRQIQEKMSTEVLPKRGCWKNMRRKFQVRQGFALAHFLVMYHKT